MFIQSPNSSAFLLFNLPVYYYGIIMAFAVFIALIISNHLYKKHEKDFIINNAPAFIISGFIGARLYFCLLNFSYYINNPLQILNFRQGGLSIHGGILFGIIALYIIAKKNKKNILQILDTISCGTILGQAIGRWGNLFNAEAFGIPTNQNWGLFIPEYSRPLQLIQYHYFHPTFLYESILNIFLFIILLYLYKKTSDKYVGLTFFSYLTIYAIIRFFIEQIRIDSALNLGSIPIAQIISIFMFIIGIIGIIYTIKHK